MEDQGRFGRIYPGGCDLRGLTAVVRRSGWVPEAPFVGGLWVVEAETHDAVVDLVVNDPYFVPEHRTFRICAWGKAIDRPVAL